jgi:hypothetical protein
MFRNFLQSQSSHIYYYINLQPIGKLLRETTTLLLETFQLKFIYKSYVHTKFLTHLFLGGTWLFSGQLKLISP